MNELKSGTFEHAFPALAFRLATRLPEILDGIDRNGELRSPSFLSHSIPLIGFHRLCLLVERPEFGADGTASLGIPFVPEVVAMDPTTFFDHLEKIIVRFFEDALLGVPDLFT